MNKKMFSRHSPRLVLYFALSFSLYSPQAWSQKFISISSNLARAFKNQYPREKQAESVYRQLGHFFQKQNMNGISHWFKTQADEERHHSELIKKHLAKANIKLSEVKNISGEKLERGLLLPRNLGGSVKNAFQLGLQQEIAFTQFFVDMEKIVENSNSADDDSKECVKWFLEEQEEEMELFRSMIDLADAHAKTKKDWVPYFNRDEKILGRPAFDPNAEEID